MKKFKKLLAVMLAAVMVMAMGSTAVFAADDSSITITGVASNAHTFEAYQIFSGTLSGSGSDQDPYVLSDIEWGKGVVVSDNSGLVTVGNKTIYQLLGEITTTDGSNNTIYPFLSDPTNSNSAVLSSAKDVAEALSKYDDNSDVAQAFADVVSKFLTTTTADIYSKDTGTDDGNGTYKYELTGMAAGYYLVKDQDNSLSGNEAYTDYILYVAGSVTQEVKSEKPTVDKTVSTSSSGTGSEATSAEIGETLYYTLEVTIPDISAYTNGYTYTLTDTLSTGLTFISTADNVVVSGVGYDSSDSEVTLSLTKGSTDDYTVSISGSVLTVKFNNVYSLLNGTTNAVISKGATFTVTYQAKLNSNAVVGNYGAASAGTNQSAGNTNTVELEYSNNPNGTGTGETSSTSTVYTYSLTVTKVDQNTTSKTLSGVEFVLMDNTGGKYAIFDSNNVLVGWTTASDFDDDDYQGTDKQTGYHITLTTDSTGQISVTGLSEGTYYLKETKAYTGYNLPDDPFTIVISASSYSLTGITSPEATIGGVTASVVANTGAVSGTIGNTQGVTIPTTGGMGTTILYIIGAILVIGAAVLLITRRRMASK